MAGTEPTLGRPARAAGSVLEAFGRAQDAIIEVAKSTAQMIEKAGAASRPGSGRCGVRTEVLRLRHGDHGRVAWEASLVVRTLAMTLPSGRQPFRRPRR